MADQHVFLSDGWIEAARGAYEQHAVTVTYKMRMNQVITACPFGDGEVRMFIDTTDGSMNSPEAYRTPYQLGQTTGPIQGRRIWPPCVWPASIKSKPCLRAQRT